MIGLILAAVIGHTVHIPVRHAATTSHCSGVDFSKGNEVTIHTHPGETIEVDDAGGPALTYIACHEQTFVMPCDGMDVTISGYTIVADDGCSWRKKK